VDPTKFLLLVQMIVLTILLGIVAFFMIIDRKKKPSPAALDDLKDVIQQTRDLSDSFQEQIQIKIGLVNKVTAELDDKIREARLVMDGLERTNVDARETKSYTPSDVLKLFKGGYEPVDISRITGIPIGEVQLMIKMKHQDTA
jgi:hypothetical protein